ncbi:MAG: hypothetical protein ACRETG_09290 [Steroidobacteraceae bacterium]
MKSKPNIDAFLQAGAAPEGRSAKPKASSSPAAPVVPSDFRKAMVMQLPVALINDLKRRALELSLSSGRRVTQQQIVEEALRRFLHN